MGYKITKIEMPKNDEWGKVQINNFTNTYFRFELVNGKPKLDTSFFADQIEDPNEKHKRLSPDSDLYKWIQQLLEDYVEEFPVINMDFQKQLAYITERRRLVEQLLRYVELIEDAVKSKDVERVQKLQEDFDYLLEQLEYVGKRI
ncbi:hypothetical protein ACFYU8_18070 [Brevibacillus sp. NPDC003359]|uniref:hypothetical protein n=1 Tax=unclassified Brevibacillus TaxID=2684853 RepID=UPI0036996F2B